MALRTSGKGSKPSSEQPKLFMSWGGEEAREIAEWIREYILKRIPGFDKPFISPLTPIGADWRATIQEQLILSTHCIGIMTDVSLNRPWFLYEMAFLKAKLDKIPLLRFCSPLSEAHPLSAVQNSDGFNFNSIVALAEGLLLHEDEVTRSLALQAIELKRQDWLRLVEPKQRAQALARGLRRAISSVSVTLESERLFRGLAHHSCMRELACKTLDDVATTFENVLTSGETVFRIDYRRYPEYLTHLQKSLACRTQAVALVEEVEEFWAQRTGKQIFETTSPESQRIFVFANPELLDKYFGNVLNHATTYSVFVMSTSEFSRAAKYRARGDFSVLSDPETGDKITAFYDNVGHNIQFTTHRGMVSSNLSIFEDILTRAHRIIVADTEAENNANRDQLKSLMFTRGAEDGQHHSDVIPIQRYDAFEEDHPYYREMHDRMLAEFRERVPQNTEHFRVLEIGAGTGHFTKKLAQQPFPNMTIKAMEPDPPARALLDAKLQHKATVQSIAASALNYDPRGRFKYVFSSFSEHHIRPDDKQRYFRTVMNAMEEGGYMIVGDEFLPPHDHNDPTAYLNALQRYHRFIIDEARKRCHFEVVALEELAWESGKPGSKIRIDYKLPLNTYKGFAEEAGLRVESEHCITPAVNASDIGGMYVLVFRKPASTGTGA